MARGRTAILVVAGVVVVGVAAGTRCRGRVEDPRPPTRGGGAMPAPSARPAPYAIRRSAPIGTAAQDPGGGGGGTGAPGHVAPPGIQGAQGSGSAQGPGGNDGRLYLSGVNLLDPNRSAATSGQRHDPEPAGRRGRCPRSRPRPGVRATGCATDAQSADYYAIPLRSRPSASAARRACASAISGSGPVTVSSSSRPRTGAAARRSRSGNGTDLAAGSRLQPQPPGRLPVLPRLHPGAGHLAPRVAHHQHVPERPQLHRAPGPVRRLSGRSPCGTQLRPTATALHRPHHCASQRAQVSRVTVWGTTARNPGHGRLRWRRHGETEGRPATGRGRRACCVGAIAYGT